jgi:hypothetical protein
MEPSDCCVRTSYGVIHQSQKFVVLCISACVVRSFEKADGERFVSTDSNLEIGLLERSPCVLDHSYDVPVLEVEATSLDTDYSNGSTVGEHSS